MSTDYLILTKADGEEIYLHEHSSMFDLEFYDKEQEITVCAADLHPSKVIIMALEMLKVASYWMDSADFSDVVKSYVDKAGEFSHEATLIRGMGRCAKNS